MESFHNTPCAKKFFSHNLSKINPNQGLTNGKWFKNYQLIFDQYKKQKRFLSLSLKKLTVFIENIFFARW